METVAPLKLWSWEDGRVRKTDKYSPDQCQQLAAPTSRGQSPKNRQRGDTAPSNEPEDDIEGELDDGPDKKPNDEFDDLDRYYEIDDYDKKFNDKLEDLVRRDEETRGRSRKRRFRSLSSQDTLYHDLGNASKELKELKISASAASGSLAEVGEL